MGEAHRNACGWGLALAVGLLFALAAFLVQPGSAPAARTTLDASIRFEGPLGTFRDLVPGPG
jgi:hypothetical protein